MSKQYICLVKKIEVCDFIHVLQVSLRFLCGHSSILVEPHVSLCLVFLLPICLYNCVFLMSDNKFGPCFHTVVNM